MRRFAALAAMPLALVIVLGFGSSSPGSDVLVFTSDSSSAASTVIWIARSDGAARRRLFTGVGPQVSPDGQLVAFRRCSRDECGTLLVMRSAGGAPTLLGDEIYSSRWAPDSEHLLVTVGDEPERLAVIDVRTGARTRLASGFFYGFDFSPSGESVVFARGGRNCDRRSDLFIVPSAGGEAVALTHGWRSVYPVWGSQGIAFARDSGACYPPTYRVWRIDPDGSDARLLTPGRISHGQGSWGWVPSAWSEDGRRLLGYRTTEFYDRPYAIDPDAGGIRPIGKDGNYFVEGLSRDGKLVLVQRETCFDDFRCATVATLSYDSGRLQVLAPKGSSPDWNR